MPQTLLALLAIVLVSMLSLNWKRSSVDQQVDAIGAELDAQARGVATEVFERLGAVRFDGAGSQATVYTSPSQLSLVGSFGGRDCDDTLNEFADVDDYDGATCELTREVTDPETGDAVAITFDVGVDVEYVKETGGRWVATNPASDPSNGRTFAKRATITLRTPLRDADDPIQLTRIYAYDPEAEPIEASGDGD